MKFRKQLKTLRNEFSSILILEVQAFEKASKI